MVDLTVIADAALGAFGEAGQAVVGGVTVDGIFDSRHYTVEGVGEVGVSELVTTLAVATSVAAARGTAVVVRETSYKVKDIRPDSEGMKVLELEIA